ncbi:MAG: succinylglutamate desuccinylase/aspartoacylase family protein [Acidobacteriota bacterium]|jgi:predicted deacylase
MLKIGGKEVPRGQRARIEIPVGRMPTQVMVSLPVRVVHGAGEGPSLWLTAAIHGDEINGVEIIRRVLQVLDPARLRGSVVAAPIVNVFGFSTHSRYLPDRRDLNRSFPGSRKGSLASRLAQIVMAEVVGPCSHGIDLHTAAAGRINLPQIRCDLDDDETRRCAQAFGAPVMMNSTGPGGSLRRAATRRGKTVLVYEAGEVLRYNPGAIEVGVEGILAVMATLDMIDARPRAAASPPVASLQQKWVRAQRGGIVHMQVELGERVVKRQPLGAISDPMGERENLIRSPVEGYVIGGITNPLVNRGDAVLHIALADPAPAAHSKMPRQLDNSIAGVPEAMQLPEDPRNGLLNGGPGDET